MSARRWSLAAFVVGTVSAAVSAQDAPEPPRPPSHAIFPTQRLPLRFDHARHLALPGVDCARCHTDAARSTRVEDRLVPPESTCVPCHAIDRADPMRAVARGAPAARCDACHEGWDRARPLAVARVEIPAANIRFSHAAHITRGATCDTCHAGVRRVSRATRLELPTMERCLTCHRAGAADDRCATCHLTEPDGVLRTRFDEGTMNPPTFMRGMHHDADFWFTHRQSASRDAARCAVCHRPSDCTDCHDGRVRDRRTHPNDFLTTHPVDARMNSDRCASCHRAASFCVACHERAGVAQVSAPQSRAFARVHPPREVWTSPPVTTRHHGAEARRAMATCVSCHAEQDCTACHATVGRGGGGFSPHPPGFASRCGSMLRASERPCAICHDDVDALRARCR